MNLIIDVGNTNIKLAVFDENEIVVKKITFKNEFIKVLEEISKDYISIKDVIVSSVGNFSEDELLIINKRYNLFVLTDKAKIPFKNKYATPKTLGVDRIALVASASFQYPNKNVLIIDVGSCITYDFLSSENNYLGGAISPGIDFRYKSLHDFTDKLPLLTPEIPSKLIGNSTEFSIHIGVIQSVVLEIDGYISLYKERYKELTIILTGGGVHYLVDSLKNDIFANSNFLLEGLNYLLEKNNKC
ncbi:MAG: type III pantothenate kinase [Flavobacteriaceae bacterium]|nr:type III pantothenate kinase [Flavobacteriaceae bacterium]